MICNKFYANHLFVLPCGNYCMPKFSRNRATNPDRILDLIAYSRRSFYYSIYNDEH